MYRFYFLLIGHADENKKKKVKSNTTLMDSSDTFREKIKTAHISKETQAHSKRK